MTEKKKCVVISSTARDLPDHRKEVMDACLRQGMFPIMMEHLPASDAEAISASLKMVDEADIYVGVFAYRYGYIPKDKNTKQISITEMEYNRAVKRKIPRCIFVMDKSHPITADDMDIENAAKLKVFKERVQRENIVNFYKSPADLRANVINSLSQYREMVSQLSLIQQTLEQQAHPSIVSETELRDIEAKYRQMVIGNFENLDFKGQIDTAEPLLLPLEKIYVQLRAVTNVPEHDEFTPEERRLLRALEEAERGESHIQPVELREAQLHIDALRRERWTKDRQERFPIAKALQSPERHGLVILGDPGSGKSTLLKFLALVFARGSTAVAEHLKITGAESLRLPIFAPLAFYDECLNSDKTLTLDDFLTRYYEHEAYPGLTPLFRQALATGRALVLLDGLDEVVKEDRRQFVSEQASSFIRRILGQGNRVLLTSRIYGYSTSRLSIDIPHVTVLDFQREDIAIFARQFNKALAEWEYQSLPPDQRQSRAQDEERQLLDEIYSNPAVERLAANPLMLSMLALLRRKVGRLPQKRIKLYAQYLEALIERWETVRSRNTRADVPIKYDTSATEFTLIPLALWLQKNKPSGTAEEAEIITQIAGDYLHELGYEPKKPEKIPEKDLRIARERAKKFLNDMRQFSGLLVERGYNAFDFRHLTFREYYVGRALARMDAGVRWKHLKPNLHANRWREPLLLAAAQLGIMQADGKAATKLIKNILEAKSEHEEVLHRDLFLAADCAADDINIEITTLRCIAKKLKLLMQSSIPALAVAATHRLSNLVLLTVADKPRLPEIVEILIRAVPLTNTDNLNLQMFVGITGSLFSIYPALQQAVIARLDDQDPDVRTATIRALTSLLVEHADLRQAVAAKLDDQDRIVRAAAIQALTALLGKYADLRQAVAAKLDDQDSEMCAAAIQAMTALLDEYADLHQAVAAKLDDQYRIVRAAAIHALTPLLGDHADLRKAVAAKLDDPNDIYGQVRTAAIHALTPLLGDHADLRKAVAAKLDDPNDIYGQVRTAAIRALTSLLGEHADLRQAIASKLDDQDNSLRAAAIEALTAQLSEYADLRQAVAAKLDDQDRQVRAAAIRALKSLSDNLYRVYQVYFAHGLNQLTCLETNQSRIAVIYALTPLLGEHDDLRKAIVTKLDDKDSFVRAAAIHALSPLLGKHADLRKAIIAKLDDPNDIYGQVRAAAIEALTPLLGEHANLCKAVAAKLDDPNDIHGQVCRAAFHALTPLLGKHADLRLVVAAKLNDQDDDIRAAAIRALTPLLGEHADLRQAVAAKLDDHVYYVGVAAFYALTPLLGEHDDLRKAIVTKLDDKDSFVRAAAIHALSPLLGKHADLRKAIIAKLDDPNDIHGQVRTAAIEALTSLLDEHADLRQAVIAKLDDPNDIYVQVRTAAIRALTSLLGEHADLRLVVAAKLNDQDDNIRAAAIEALTPLLGEHADLRHAVAAKLDDRNVVTSAIGALTPLLGEYADLRQAVAAMLDDQDSTVRLVAINALAFLIPSWVEIRLLLKPALACEISDMGFVNLEGRYSQGNIATGFSQWIKQDVNGRAEVITMLRSEDSNIRRNAIEILAQAGEDALLEAKSQLLQALDDYRGYDSWPTRITTAEMLLNDINYSQEAINTLLPALEYCTNPLVIVRNAADIRRQAALAFGKLKAEFRRPEVIEKIIELLRKEKEPEVLDSLFSALQSLVAAPE
jgi:energy-coupling factor transporter ATP-binding protein EcfA2